ncbi:hypothetical protein GQ600_2441 [Phytophthora cactorum]|nr:hypothetical protein GQ600_2441 [Phytophthora cactorum]
MTERHRLSPTARRWKIHGQFVLDQAQRDMDQLRIRRGVDRLAATASSCSTALRQSHQEIKCCSCVLRRRASSNIF